jgi:Tfp pilus assembly protein PilV
MSPSRHRRTKDPALSLPAVSPSNRANGPALSKRSASNGFTIVEVMMAAVILVVAFFGMIQAITIGSEMMATARRQTIANQIITHEIEKLRLKDWTTISNYTAIASATYTSDSADINAEIAGSGVSFTLATAVVTPTTDLREVTFTVTWTKSGTTTASGTTSGSLLNQLSFSRLGPIARTYTRVGVAYFTKYGLDLSTQRS